MWACLRGARRPVEPPRAGLCASLGAGELDACMGSVKQHVAGKIGLKVYKGSARVVTRSSPTAVYDAELATFETCGGLFSQQAWPGFIEVWALQPRMAHRLRVERDG